ncbi:MAG TPA: hypothetical protein VFW44_01300 [Bryobacteraceae bacterium]|nr:hypothetical protein [Bryobacteraceae bacterium]
MVDDQTAAYIVENQRCFEDFKQIAAQLAGLLVLAAAGSKEAAPDHPTLLAARELFRDAEEAFRLARPTEAARKHHRHLARAAELLGSALAATDSRLNVDRILIPLRAGYTELERAADALPGFEKVSYVNACCGMRVQ